MPVPFIPIEKALELFRKGEILVVMDDENRENEGDLIMSAEFATDKKIAFFLRHTTGILCAPMTEAWADSLKLPPMVVNNEDPKCTAFTLTCDLIEGNTTGVSAHDRANTFIALADPSQRPERFHRPGHVFPLRARNGGVLERGGHTEASVDLCRLAGVQPVGVIGELMHDDGTMMRLPACQEFVEKNGLHLITIEALAEYRRKHIDELFPVPSTTRLQKEITPIAHVVEAPKDQTASNVKNEVELVAECPLPIERRGQFMGIWKQQIFVDKPGNKYIVLSIGDIATGVTPVLARIHSECFTGDLIGSRRCDCGFQLDQSFRIITKAGCGIIIYCGGHEGRGIGLVNKVRAYKLQMEQNLDTYESNAVLGFPFDMRTYTAPLAILKALGVQKIELLTNNPLKVNELKEIVASVRPIRCAANQHNAGYLACKHVMEKRHATENKLVELMSEGQPSIKSPTKASVTPALTSPLEPAVPQTFTGENFAHADQLKLGVILANWNGELVQQIWEGVKADLLKSGVCPQNIFEETVPGAYELPLAAQFVASKRDVDAVLCIAVLIQLNDATHFECAAQAVSQGLMQVQLCTSVPVLCGVVSCLTEEQALRYVDEGVPKSLALSTLQMAGMKKFRYTEESTGK